jgi:hypothetical protein
MGFLKRLVGGGDPPAPEWAAFFSGSEYRQFLDVVVADLRRRGLDPQVGDGFITADTGGEEPTQWGLANLAQRCNQEDPSRWESIVATHFTALQQMVGRDLDALGADFEQVRPILRVRLMPDESMGGVAIGETASRRPASGIVANLVYDFPDSTASVHEDHLAGWPVDADEAFDIAIANVRAEPPPAAETIDADGVELNVMAGDSFYVASRALFLGELLDGARDGVFAVPNRHVLIWYPLADLSVVKAMSPMFQIAMNLFREGPGSISDQLYWWRGGEFVHLPHTATGKNINFVPPDDFVALLNGLAEPPPR